MLDEKGEVIGIVTLTNNQGQNLNFAITSQDIYSKRALVWNREHPEGVDLLAKLQSMMSAAQYDNARSIIEKYLADRLAVRNDPALDVPAKKAKLDQLVQEYDANISDILTREQKERLAAEEAAKKPAAGAK